jgi:hypothetical protein
LDKKHFQVAADQACALGTSTDDAALESAQSATGKSDADFLEAVTTEKARLSWRGSIAKADAAAGEIIELQTKHAKLVADPRPSLRVPRFKEMTDNISKRKEKRNRPRSEAFGRSDGADA